MATPDIFGREQQYVPMDFATSDKMVLRIGTVDVGEEYLVQNLAFQYNQPLNRIYEIGSPKVYLAKGRSIGTLQLGRIIGQRHITEIFGDTGYGMWSTDLSQGSAATRVLSFAKKGGSQFGNSLKFIMTGAVIESYGFATDANGLLSQENISMQFAGLAFGFQNRDAGSVGSGSGGDSGEPATSALGNAEASYQDTALV